MFTGLVRALGEVVELRASGPDLRLRIRCGAALMQQLQIGDSIAVNGVCLTAVIAAEESLVVDLSAETMSCTTLGRLQPGERLNLELSLSADGLLGGHLISGHVGGIGEVLEMSPTGRCHRFHIGAPQPLMRYIANKGSIAVDGVSLTVNALGARHFAADIVPHTLRATLFGSYRPGTRCELGGGHDCAPHRAPADRQRPVARVGGGGVLGAPPCLPTASKIWWRHCAKGRWLCSPTMKTVKTRGIWWRWLSASPLSRSISWRPKRAAWSA